MDYSEGMTKGERRSQKSVKARYGHCGAGASHTRETSTIEVERHIQKIKISKRNK